ncbi:MAG: chemotaxis protein [Thioalkalispiraceae bacterium]|jgi:two-component system chemotaxis response regulator CheV
MAGVMAGVDQRTNLVGENRLELLLFGLGGRQMYGINVFKVQEVIQCPPLTAVPHAHPIVRGIASMRGKTITIMDLAMAIGRKPIELLDDQYVIVTEYNRSQQGFLVGSVDRIVNLTWKEILAPPRGVGKNNYMTAVTRVEEQLVEIIDVEKVLAELVGMDIELSEESTVKNDENKTIKLLVADDSLVARKQVKSTLDKVGLECDLAKNGAEALKMLQAAVADGKPLSDTYDVMISDIEMPEMDGYTLTTEVRADERLKHLPIMLHTSLSGTFNSNMVKKVGADKFVAKFDASELAREVRLLMMEKGLISENDSDQDSD